MSDGLKAKRVRRRRAWYRRRLRVQRITLAALVGSLIAIVCWQNAAHYLSLPSLHAAQVLPDSFWTRGNVHKDLASLVARSTGHPKKIARTPAVYPYSVVPGGVKSPEDLRFVAARDYVVRRHYARFDFNHARLVRATEAREVYLSYRIRDAVYWTHKKVRLHPGELLLTDGKITARARCGNQISEAAKPEVSEEEPAEDVLDRAVAAIDSPTMPVRPLLAVVDLPSGQPTPPKLFGGGFIFPYVPIGVPLPGRCGPGDREVHGRCHPKPNAPVPEPSTMLLIVSGLAIIVWRYRNIARPFGA